MLEGIAEKMAALRSALDDHVDTTGRLHRSYRDHGLRDADELETGIWSLIAGQEKDYPTTFGLVGKEGVLEVSMVGHCRVAETDEPADLETLELAMLAEAKTFARGLAIEGLDVHITRMEPSQLLAHPAGFCIVYLEAGPPARNY